jgi:hypothetical protein
MKKYGFLFVLGILVLSLAGCDACKENPLTKIGDSIATIGKSGLEKNTILAQRTASRATKCAEQKAAELKKKVGF